MLQDVHTRKISQAIGLAPGDNVVIPVNPDEWHYIHELIGDMDSAGFIEVLAVTHATGIERNLAKINLADSQGITLQDEPGEDNRPRFEFNPHEDAVIRVSGGNFVGSLDWSKRN